MSCPGPAGRSGARHLIGQVPLIPGRGIPRKRGPGEMFSSANPAWRGGGGIMRGKRRGLILKIYFPLRRLTRPCGVSRALCRKGTPIDHDYPPPPCHHDDTRFYPDPPQGGSAIRETDRAQGEKTGQGRLFWYENSHDAARPQAYRMKIANAIFILNRVRGFHQGESVNVRYHEGFISSIPGFSIIG